MASEATQGQLAHEPGACHTRALGEPFALGPFPRTARNRPARLGAVGFPVGGAVASIGPPAQPMQKPGEAPNRDRRGPAVHRWPGARSSRGTWRCCLKRNGSAEEPLRGLCGKTCGRFTASARNWGRCSGREATRSPNRCAASSQCSLGSGWLPQRARDCENRACRCATFALREAAREKVGLARCCNEGGVRQESGVNDLAPTCVRLGYK